MKKTVRMLGTHGVPAAYGGFETAAENIARYLVKNNWRVVVYCQEKGDGPITEDTWEGIERVHIPVMREGWLGTSHFDWLSIQHACQSNDLCLTFGYNTAIFNILFRLRGIPNVINMDGIEWSRARWGFAKQAILYINERIGCFVGNHLIADHPEIEKYLLTRAPQRKITTLTYGADQVLSAPSDQLNQYKVEPNEYFILVARSIPENSILEMVRGFSMRRRGKKLLILGAYDPKNDDYHRDVISAASDEVVFAGAIYDTALVQAMRFHSICYVHGHTVGGTNPSLVEAMGAGCPVIAHDNVYNRWVAQEGAVFFKTADEFGACVDSLLSDSDKLKGMSVNSRRRFLDEFTWDFVASQYESLLKKHLPTPVQ